jgi:hypothetical protein
MGLVGALLAGESFALELGLEVGLEGVSSGPADADPQDPGLRSLERPRA